MADIKFSQLNSLSSADLKDSDVLVINDVSVSTTKQITREAFLDGFTRNVVDSGTGAKIAGDFTVDNELTVGGDLETTGKITFGSLQDHAEGIFISKFVDAADTIANNLTDSSIPTSLAVRDYVALQTASNIASYAYHTADRWRVSANGTGASTGRVTDMSVVTNTDIAGDFIGNYVRFNTTTAATSPASNASVGYNYRMEPQDIIPYLGKEMTLSFYARSNAGIAINSGFVSGTTASSITFINSGDSSTWVTLTSDWKRYTFTFTLGLTVPTTHMDIGIRHQPGIVGNVDLTGIQLEQGNTATVFEHRTYAEELALCQRYCYAAVADGSIDNYAPLANGRYYSATNAQFNIFFPVTMRYPPTLDSNTTAAGTFFYNTGGGFGGVEATQLTLNERSYNSATVTTSGATGQTAGDGTTLYSHDAEVAKLIFTAEL